MQGSYEVNYWGVEAGFLAMPVIRGVTMLSLGIALYDIMNYLATATLKKWKSGMISVVELLLLGYYIYNNGNFHGTLAFLLFLTCTLSDKGWFSWLFNRQCFKSCEKWSLLIYINHALIIRVCRVLFKGDLSKAYVVLPVYLAMLFLYSYIMEKGISYVRKKWSTGVPAK